MIPFFTRESLSDAYLVPLLFRSSAVRFKFLLPIFGLGGVVRCIDATEKAVSEMRN